MSRRPVSGRAYLLTWLALLALTALSFLTSFAHFSARPDLAIALGIAAVKSGLVLMFFMHLVEQRSANRVVVVVALLLAIIFITLAATDVASRHTFPVRPEPPSAEPL